MNAPEQFAIPDFGTWVSPPADTHDHIELTVGDGSQPLRIPLPAHVSVDDLTSSRATIVVYGGGGGGTGDQTDLGASDDFPLGPDHPVYRR